MTTTEALPEPYGIGGYPYPDTFTKTQLIDYAGRVSAAKDVANLELAKLASGWMDIATAKDAEIERLNQEHIQRLLRIEGKVDALIAQRDTLRTALVEKDAECSRLRAALKLIASCQSKIKGDVVDIAQEALKESK